MPSHPQNSAARPFLRWVGGKARLLPLILPHFPAQGRLIEPFLGAGAVFLGSNLESAVLGDANLDLIAVWTAIRERPREFIARASSLFVEANRSPQAYTHIRAEYNVETDSFERAIRFIYLNKFCFNGVHRVNRKGAFNVPYGKPRVLPRFPFDEVAAASAKLQTATLVAGGFQGTVEQAGSGDIVYADPPYADLSAQPSFTSYTAGGFGWADQVALVRCALEAVSRGATVVISNHDTSQTRELYREFELVAVSASRSVAASGASRGRAAEILAIGRPRQSPREP